MICGACWRESSSPEACSACGEPPLLSGRYRLDKQLGQGAGGITFAATRIADGLPVCVKGLAYRGMSTFDAERLFHREAAVLRSIRHPQVPAYIDDFAHGAGPSFTLYLVQELVIGEDLEAEVRRKRPTTAEIMGILGELLAIVEHLHALRPAIVHRDIKPRNIMRRSTDGRLVLVDFGSVKEVTQASFDAGLSLQGTLGFMAPEQLRGEASARSDLYAIGMVGVTLLSGREPTSMMNAEHQVEWEAKVELPEGLRRWLRRITAGDPAERFADAGEARRALAAATRPEATPAVAREERAPQPVPWTPPAPESEPTVIAKPGRGPLIAMLAGLGVLVVGALVLAGKGSDGITKSAAYVEQRPPASVCNGPCRPVSVPFKEKLRFGMTLEEARAARADVAQAGPPPDSTRSTNAVDIQRAVEIRQWLTSLGSALGATQVCMSSELVGKDALCCLDFLPAIGLVRLMCGTDRGFSSAELLAMIEQVTRIYGPPAEAPDEGRQFGFEVLRDAVWQQEGNRLQISYAYSFDIPGGGAEDLTRAMMNPSQRLIMTQTSAALNAEMTRIDNEHKRALDAQRAEAERARQLEIERAREERRKLGLPPDPL